MSAERDIYSYTHEQLMAMWRAYCIAPADTTVGELRALMDDAAAKVAE